MSKLTQEQDKLEDRQIWDAQSLLRAWGCGPTNNRMIYKLAAMLQYAPASAPEGPCSTCGDGGQDMCSRHRPAPVEQPAQSGASEESHAYVSTACHHELHSRCRQRCKFCSVNCGCACHNATDVMQDRPQAPTPASQPVRSPQPPQAGASEQAGMVERAIAAARQAGLEEDGFKANNLAVTATAALRVAMDEALGQMTADEEEPYRDNRSIELINAFLKSRRSRLLAPAVPAQKVRGGSTRAT